MAHYLCRTIIMAVFCSILSANADDVKTLGGDESLSFDQLEKEYTKESWEEAAKDLIHNTIKGLLGGKPFNILDMKEAQEQKRWKFKLGKVSALERAYANNPKTMKDGNIVDNKEQMKHDDSCEQRSFWFDWESLKKMVGTLTSADAFYVLKVPYNADQDKETPEQFTGKEVEILLRVETERLKAKKNDIYMWFKQIADNKKWYTIMVMPHITSADKNKFTLRLAFKGRDGSWILSKDLDFVPWWVKWVVIGAALLLAAWIVYGYVTGQFSNKKEEDDVEKGEGRSRRKHREREAQQERFGRQ